MLNYVEKTVRRKVDGEWKDARCIHALYGARLAGLIEDNTGDYWTNRETPWKTYISERPCYPSKHEFEWHHDMEYLGSFGSVLEARRAIEAKWSEVKDTVQRRIDIKALPAFSDTQFYPTPSALVGKMLAGVKWDRNIKTILEPSAGKGDICEGICRMLQNNPSTRDRFRDEEVAKAIIDCIEIDPNLQSILIGKGFRVVGDDWLTFKSAGKQYDAIVMNPPFEHGDLHLLKALEMQKENGGIVVCLLNAESIRNPYTDTRWLLKQKLAECGARIEFIKGAFKHAERPTDVEIAIITAAFPEPTYESEIYEGLKKAAKEREEANCDPEAIVPAKSWVESLVANFCLEAELGKRLIHEYVASRPYIMNGSNTYARPLITLKVGEHCDLDGQFYSTSEVINRYMEMLRLKYWRSLLDRREVTGKMTSKLRESYEARIQDLAEYDFSEWNIRRFLVEIQSQLVAGVEESIYALFEKLSAEFSWDPGSENNRHYYNGWATNKSWKVNDKKVIIPCNGAFAERWDRYAGKKMELSSYSICGIIPDLEQVFDYLDSGRTTWHNNLELEIGRANAEGKTELQCTYFNARFYKKGTCHLRFNKDGQRLIEKLNIFAARGRNWLPPTYGKVRYEDMTPEDKAIIDDFQGAEAYTRVMADPGFYLAGVDNAALLTA